MQLGYVIMAISELHVMDNLCTSVVPRFLVLETMQVMSVSAPTVNLPHRHQGHHLRATHTHMYNSCTLLLSVLFTAEATTAQAFMQVVTSPRYRNSCKFLYICIAVAQGANTTICPEIAASPASLRHNKID